MIRKVLIIIFIVLILIFILEAITYLETERLKKKIYILRDKIIKLEMRNRQLRLEYRQLMEPQRLHKWAKEHGFIEKWNRLEKDEK